jgi:hypothetical protein
MSRGPILNDGFVSRVKCSAPCGRAGLAREVVSIGEALG